MPKNKIMKKNIVLIGMMGCGKTTISHLLAERFQMPVVDVDEYIENQYHMTIPEMFEISEDYFRQCEQACCEIIGEWEGFVISTGGGVIKNIKNIEALKKNGIVIYIDRPVEHILRDIDTQSRPLLKDGATLLYDLYQQRHHLYLKACDYRIENTSSLGNVVDEIIEKIKEVVQL